MSNMSATDQRLWAKEMVLGFIDAGIKDFEEGGTEITHEKGSTFAGKDYDGIKAMQLQRQRIAKFLGEVS